MLPGGIKQALAVLGGASHTARSNPQTRQQHVIRRKFATPVDHAAVERDWQKAGFLGAGVMIDPPGHEWNNYTHECNEVVTVKAGCMRFTLLDQQLVLEPGDELYIPAGVPHSTKNIAATHTTWFYGYDGAANSWF